MVHGRQRLVPSLLLCASALGCGGEVESDAGSSTGGLPGAGAPGGATSGGRESSGGRGTNLSSGGAESGGSNSGGSDSGGSDSGGSDSGEAGGNGATQAASDYVPVRSDVSVVGDGRLSEGGSVETSQGFGWDTCATKTPGFSLVGQGEELLPGQGPADGEAFMAFRPMGSWPTSSEGWVTQVAFFPEAPFEAGTPLHVYFEIRNLSTKPPSGQLSLAPVTQCRLEQEETTIPLEALAPGPAWETRCVELLPAVDDTWVGLWVTGEDFAIGIDAVRVGPPCK